MADFDTGDAERPPSFDDIGMSVWSKLWESGVLGHAANAVSGWITWGIMGAVAVLIRVAVPVASTIARGIARGEEASEISFGELASVTIEHTLGVTVPSGSWIPRTSAGGREGAIDQIGQTLLNKIAPAGGGDLQPSIAGVNKWLQIPLKTVLEGWLEGWIIEMITDIPSMPGVKTYAELPALLTEALGLGRLSRSVLAPLVNTTVVVPATWAIHKTYRPTLLGTAEAVHQYMRGRWTVDRMNEELSRHGLSQDRIDAIVSVNKLHLTTAEIAEGLHYLAWPRDQAVLLLRDAGYDDDTAARILAIDQLRRQQAEFVKVADAAIDAYGRGQIDDNILNTAIRNVTLDPVIASAMRDRAATLRTFRQHPLSEAQLEHAVKRSIIPMSEYRAGLRRLGYDEESIGVLEFIVRDEIKDADTARQQKALRAAEVAAEKKKREQEAAQRKAELEAKRMHQEPSLAQVERAVVRGLVGPDSYQAYLSTHHYDGPTISFLVAQATQDRQAYVQKQKEAADARARAERSGLSTGELETAVERGSLSLGEFRDILRTRKLSAEDIDTLSSVADQRHADRDAALKKRAEAEAKAKTKAISLTEEERAVRRGVATVADYQGKLAKLGFDAGDQATLVSLLQSEIAADHAAQQKRDEAAQKAAQKGISLAQEERAVLLGVRPLDDYRALLGKLGYSGADLATLVDLLHQQLTDAQAARARRAELERQRQEHPLPLATVERAVTLGALPLGAFTAYLTRYHYTPADQQVLVSLETLQIQAAADAKARREAAHKQPGAPTETLAQIERAVRAGVQPIDAYGAALAKHGYSPEDRTVLTNLLIEETALQQDAAKRHDQILAEGTSKSVSLATEEKALKAGTITMATFAAYLAREGYDEADRALLQQLNKA